jgi:hypothetical protein
MYGPGLAAAFDLDFVIVDPAGPDVSFIANDPQDRS